jgi:imidazole glycerol-phosphate synthase subunit HisH
MITIVDYGLGNVSAFSNVFKRLGLPSHTATKAQDLAEATRIILPGVGAFDHAMELLEASGMRPALEERVLTQRVPVIGICVGMQILADSSEEGTRPGLGWVPGRVRSFANTVSTSTLALPHMGWNDVKPSYATAVFKGLETDSRFYFLHSYFFECTHTEHRAASTAYGLEFASAVQRDNVCGVQFHPEKSHHWGENLLANFARQS